MDLECTYSSVKLGFIAAVKVYEQLLDGASLLYCSIHKNHSFYRCHGMTSSLPAIREQYSPHTVSNFYSVLSAFVAVEYKLIQLNLLVDNLICCCTAIVDMVNVECFSNIYLQVCYSGKLARMSYILCKELYIVLRNSLMQRKMLILHMCC